MTEQPVMTERLRDRLRGVAVGAAVGDALGMPLEFRSKRPANHLVTEMTIGRLPAGSFTDDTEMALALASSLLDHRPLNTDDLAQRFVAWAQTNPPDIGIHTRSVLSRIEAGEPWDEAVQAVQSLKPDSAGNGSLMRCWPAALAHWCDLDNLLVDSWQQSRVTHPHPDCLTASAFANVLIYYLLQGMPPDAALTATGSTVRTPDAFLNRVFNAHYKNRDELANSGWVMDTLESAIWSLVITGSFEDAVVQVVNLGRDADTAGAVVGALAGAHYGLGAIPPRWRDTLRGEWPVGSGQLLHAADFIALADRLADGASAA